MYLIFISPLYMVHCCHRTANLLLSLHYWLTIISWLGCNLGCGLHFSSHQKLHHWICHRCQNVSTIPIFDCSEVFQLIGSNLPFFCNIRYDECWGHILLLYAYNPHWPEELRCLTSACHHKNSSWLFFSFWSKFQITLEGPENSIKSKYNKSWMAKSLASSSHQHSQIWHHLMAKQNSAMIRSPIYSIRWFPIPYLISTIAIGRELLISCGSQ